MPDISTATNRQIRNGSFMISATQTETVRDGKVSSAIVMMVGVTLSHDRIQIMPDIERTCMSQYAYGVCMCRGSVCVCVCVCVCVITCISIRIKLSIQHSILYFNQSNCGVCSLA